MKSRIILYQPKRNVECEHPPLNFAKYGCYPRFLRRVWNPMPDPTQVRLYEDGQISELGYLKSDKNGIIREPNK